MLYEWHDHVSHAVQLSMRALSGQLWFSGQMMQLFNHAARAPAFQKIIDETISCAGIFNQLAQNQPTPSFGFTSIGAHGRAVPVREEILSDKPFGQLLHFHCEGDGQMSRPESKQVPKVLIVAPISGHKATILRDTVQTLLADHDVYLTQWKDARDVPVAEGNFDLETYMDYVQDFIRTVGPQTHVMGISQSTVPVLAVSALMAARHDPARPLSMTLMCGPIDPRIQETAISRLSRQRDIEWFRQHMITEVAAPYAGHGRAVFPGFMQAAGMMIAAPGQKPMTPTSFIGKMYGGQGEKIDADAPYYLDTIQQVFLEHRLPRGVMTWRDERVDLGAIKDISLLTVEGSADNITAPGQTKVAHDLCTALDGSYKHHYQQHGAGHYDVFSGPHWRDKISAMFKNFVRDAGLRHNIEYDPPVNDGRTLITFEP